MCVWYIERMRSLIRKHVCGILECAQPVSATVQDISIKRDLLNCGNFLIIYRYVDNKCTLGSVFT